MSKRVSFRQSDLTRALKVAALVGLKVQRFEIDAEGKIVVVTGEVEQPDPAAISALREWDARRALKRQEKERAEVREGTLRVFGQPARRRGRHDPAPT